MVLCPCQAAANVLIHRKYFLHVEAFVIHLDQAADGKGISQGLGRLCFAWKGGQEAPAIPQRGIPELNPTEPPHSWGGWRSLCRAHGAAPRVALGSLDGGGTQRCPGAVCRVGQAMWMLLVAVGE